MVRNLFGGVSSMPKIVPECMFRFVPYFEWNMADKWVPNWSKDQEGNRVRNGDRYITKGDVIWSGIKEVWKDRKRILSREWYHSEEY